MIIKILTAYFAVINLVGFFSMYRDKRLAVKGLWRTPENRLLLYALLGGSLGSILGMQLFRHKTHHLRFAVGLPIIFLAQLSLALVIIGRLS